MGFWAVKGNTSSGSWIWKKLLKYRDKARQLHRVEVNNGESTSFWFDSWSPLGYLYEKLGERLERLYRYGDSDIYHSGGGDGYD